MNRLVVIGGNAAGLSAAAAAKRCDSGMEVLVFEQSAYVSYSSCSMPFFISGEVSSPQELIVHDPGYFKQERNIDVHIKHLVTSIHPSRHIIRVRDLTTNASEDVYYSRLMIATGAVPASIRAAGLQHAGIFTLRRMEHVLEIKQFLAEYHPETALIVGAGYIGLEMAEAFSRAGLDVTLVEAAQAALPGSAREIRERISALLAEHGVTFLPGTTVERFIGTQQRVTHALLSSGRECPAGIVLICTGVQPETGPAKAAGIPLGRSGAIHVGPDMETEFPGIYAAGDCAEIPHILTGRAVYFPLATVANKLGRLAGENIAGQRNRFPGVCGTLATRIFNLEYARTGLTQQQALREGFHAVSIVINHRTRASWLRQTSPLIMQMTADPRTGRLLGVEMLGENIGKRIDTVATAIFNRMSVRDIPNLDLAYSPPVSPAWDSLIIAANQLMKKMNRMI